MIEFHSAGIALVLCFFCLGALSTASKSTPATPRTSPGRMTWSRRLLRERRC